MKTFLQWLENEKRSRLGIRPPQGVGQYPPLAQTPHSATAALALTTIHKKTMDKIMKKKGKKKRKKKKKD